jgi:predicted DNA-binding mobile mystery protein A
LFFYFVLTSYSFTFVVDKASYNFTFMAKSSLQMQQLNSKMLSFKMLNQIAIPPTGWIRAIRQALGMSSQQLGKKLSITRQGVLDMEKREKDGLITLKALREAAKALDMQVVYGFVPNDGSLEELIDRKAKALAEEIVMRTSQSMKLENQENSKTRIEKALLERFMAIRNEMPKTLWD